MKILVVEDDVASSRLLVTVLEHEGHEVCCAANGEDGLKSFSEFCPDMIFTDIMMPGMGGYTVAKRIREMSERYVPVIFVTAIADNETIVKCLDLGDDYIIKPYNPVILAARMGLYEKLLQCRTGNGGVFDKAEQLQEDMSEKIMQRVAHRSEDGHPCVFSKVKSEGRKHGDLVLVSEMPAGGFAVMIGHFTGKGLASVVGALPVSDVFYSMCKKGYHVHDIVSEMNQHVGEILPTGMFLSACVIQVNEDLDAMSVWNGGMPDVLVASSKDPGNVRYARSRHTPMGVLGSGSIDTRPDIVAISEGDQILLYTDSIADLEGRDDTFGEERLIRIIQNGSRGEALLGDISAALEDFSGKEELSEDMVMAVIDCNRELASQASDRARKQAENSKPVDWSVALEFQGGSLKEVDPVPAIMQMCTEVQRLGPHHSNIYTILSELYNNAVDHGLLGLDSSLKEKPEGFVTYYNEREKRLGELNEGKVSITLTTTCAKDLNSMKINVTDTGKGFDFHSSGQSLEENTGHSGRGIKLIKTLCESVEYSGNGSTVEVEYCWESSPEEQNQGLG